ncbi:MAG: hypothetical protein U9R08_02015 [Nanoarchaeota archaeon]|nr:hypothetical protein [Nanoarchaeota archaeon]
MKRKVNRVGQNTLTVSLPSKWVEENKIEKGNELNINTEGNNITLSKSEIKKKCKEISFNIDNYNYFALNRHLTILYRMDFDRIILTYSNNLILHPKKQKEMSLNKSIIKLIERYIGAEIVSQSTKKTEIECFVTSEILNLQKIEQRIYFLMKQAMNEMINSIGKDYKEFHDTMYNIHDNISKFINYYLRTLYASDKEKEEKKLSYALYQVIDKVVDKLRHIDEAIFTYGCTPKAKKLLKEIFNYFCEQMLLIKQKEVGSDFIQKRYSIVDKVKKTNFTIKELRVIMEADLLLNTINDFSEHVYLRKSLREL